ncbi:MAG: hypothetical protein WBZ20_17550, partial [Nitrososphaeraceae archaeon]
MREENYKQALTCTACIIFTITVVLSTLFIIPINIISDTLVLNNAVFAQMSSPSSLSPSSTTGDENNNNNNNNNSIPSARSVFDTGTISLPSSAKGFIISLPDETHELDTANRTVSHQNAHY